MRRPSTVSAGSAGSVGQVGHEKEPGGMPSAKSDKKKKRRIFNKRISFDQQKDENRSLAAADESERLTARRMYIWRVSVPCAASGDERS